MDLSTFVIAAAAPPPAAFGDDLALIGDGARDAGTEAGGDGARDAAADIGGDGRREPGGDGTREQAADAALECTHDTEVEEVQDSPVSTGTRHRIQPSPSSIPVITSPHANLCATLRWSLIFLLLLYPRPRVSA